MTVRSIKTTFYLTEDYKDEEKIQSRKASQTFFS
jgi:quinol monooxygenase YgiN